MADMPPALRELVAPHWDPEAAQAAWLLRQRALEDLCRASGRDGLRDVLLVKGAGLSLTAYRKPWHRPMKDVDLLVPEARAPGVADVLERAGFTPVPMRVGRPRTAPLLGERKFERAMKQTRVVVELHTQLEGVTRRPVDMGALLAASGPAPGLDGFRVPAPVDGTMLVALHAAADRFGHPWGMVDLHLLMREGVDARELAARARAWRAGTALFLALQELDRLGGPVDGALLEVLAPSGTRRRIARWMFDRGPERFRRPTGWRFVATQAVLRDDPGRYAVGVARYAALRAIEKLEGKLRGSP